MNVRHGGPDWISYPARRLAATTRLFCFPFAGSGDSCFAGWAAEFPSSVELAMVRLPGREARFREPLIDRMDYLVAELSAAVSPHLDLPFAFFGHSMGARLAFELARDLRRNGGSHPSHLFVSACQAPHLPTGPPIYDYPQELLVERIRQMGGTPPEVFDNSELMEILLPVIRADMRALETCDYLAEQPLDYPIHAFAGMTDQVVALDTVAAWREHSRAEFTLTRIQGGHFYLQERRRLLVRSMVSRLLARSLSTD